MTVLTCQQLAAALERAARIAAPCIALLITAALLLADLAYQLGLLTGQAVHARCQQLARLASQVATHQHVLPATTVLPIPHPTWLLAADLEQLTTRQLRQLTGIRRKLSKRELIACAVAC